MRHMKNLLPLVVAVMLPQLAAAQSVSLQDNVLQDWTRVKDTMMNIAAAMPDDKFGYRATAPERTWGEQILHVAEANIVQMGRLGSKGPPPAYDMKVISWLVGLKRGVSTSSCPLLSRRTLKPS